MTLMPHPRPSELAPEAITPEDNTLLNRVPPIDKKVELERLVLDYLQNHPRFFERHLSALSTLKIPAHQSDGTLSLLEKQRESLQKNIQQLRLSLAEKDSDNKETFDQLARIHRLQCNLLLCVTLSDVVALMFKQCQARLGYTPQLWLWDLPQDANSTMTLLKLPIASPALIQFAESAPTLGFLPPGAEVDAAITSFISTENQTTMVLPIIPPTPNKRVCGLFLLSQHTTTTQFQHSFQNHLLISRCAEWIVRLLEGYWIRAHRS